MICFLKKMEMHANFNCLNDAMMADSRDLEAYSKAYSRKIYLSLVTSRSVGTESIQESLQKFKRLKGMELK